MPNSVWLSCAVLKQARAIKAKLDIARGEDDESESSEDSSEEEEEEEEDGWGARKSAYYNADNIDMEGSEEDEDLQAEEEEARRLQKEAASRLQAGDYGDRRRAGDEPRRVGAGGDHDHRHDTGGGGEAA